MRSLALWLLSPCVASFLFWLFFGACIAAEPPSGGPQASVIVEWDPTACGDPHRIAFELAADNEPTLSRSAPCALGALELDGVAYGAYHGRIYAWQLGEAIRSIAPVEMEIDQRVVRWPVATPR
jgi:hypothetical protein